MDKKKEREAVFWCSLLRPVLFGEIPRGEITNFLRQLCEQEFVFPDGRRRKPSLRTLERRLQQYREAGFDGMARKPRSDRGRVRAVPPEVIQTAIEAKKDQPWRSAQMINEILEARHGKKVPRSTLYRQLSKAGATRRKLGVSKKAVRKRWSKEHTHDMWIGDFSHGPPVLVDGEAVRTHLSAFIDVHSRYVVAARYYLRETTDILCDTLIRAWTAHGCPLALYVDNAKVYYSHSLKTACWRLHINLRHRPPRDPAAGGLIERFFLTAQTQLEAEVRAGEILSLQKLNQAFGAWLDVAYHATGHSEIGQTPRERYDAGLVGIRQVDLGAVAESFLQSEMRTVDKDFSDIRLHNRFYKVDPRLRGDRVEVRYDPFCDHTEVFLYSREGEYLGKGIRHEREQGERPACAPTGRAQMDVLGTLIGKQQKLFTEEAVDYRQAAKPRCWPFEAFANCLAALLGRKGALSAFSADELQALRNVHFRHPRLTRTLLKKAFVKAGAKTIPAIVYELQNLKE